MSEIASELNTFRVAPHAPFRQISAPRQASTPSSRRNFDFGHAYDPQRVRPVRAKRLRTGIGFRSLAGLAFVVVCATGAAFAHRAGALDRDAVASALGFGIEQVSMTGYHFTPDADLFAALDLKSARSLMSFDAGSARSRFERLPWVQSVEISRVWPGQLDVRVKERKAFAIWERDDGAELVDATGRVLGPVKRDAVLDHLPKIAGEGAAAAAAPLLAALDRYPAIKSRVERVRRHGDRRWTLELADGGRIHLPSDGETSALARLAAEPGLISLVEQPAQIIDLRSPSKIAIRSAGPAEGGGDRR
ncbi:MAG: cell division protein FtsQ/DivIB [Deltaproteobacteria bacterium]